MKQFDQSNLTQFILYRGVIEDNNDPLQIKRVQVRIFGIHTENNENSSDNFEFIKTSELPWAEVMGGTDLGLIGGKGLSSVLQKGTWVWVILENNDPNKPVIIGTIAGVNSKSSSGVYTAGKGFVDPDGINPVRSTETDINPLARGTSANNLSGTAHAIINTNKATGEPTSTSNLSEYSKCAVLETKSGHTIEIDDTSGNEKIRIFHKSGPYLEFNKDGKIHIHGNVKIFGNLEVSQEITAGSHVTSKAEVADVTGNLSSLRDAYDAHYHIGNLGVPTAIPTTTDPRERTTDFDWDNP